MSVKINKIFMADRLVGRPEEAMPERNALDVFIDRSNFAKTLGIRIRKYGEGTAEAVMEVGKEHLNGFGTVHGAAIFALADEAFAVACNSRGQVSMAVQISISYLKAASGGELTATAREISSGPKLGNYQIEIVDGGKNLVAVFQGLCYRKKEAVESFLDQAGLKTGGGAAS